MGSRICPGCHTKVTIMMLLLAGGVFPCRHCKTELESDPVSKQMSVWAGLIAGVVAWRAVGHQGGTFAWLLPVLVPFAAFSVVTPLALALVGGVRAPAVSQPAEKQGH